jgi:regulator of sirC expression with transglutaminase-like and TPR domain
MSKVNSIELKALITLLDDPDEEIFSSIRKKIFSFGNEVIPHLELAWESSFDNLVQKRIENIIHEIQFENSCKRIRHWYKNGSKELLEGVLCIAQYQYPDLDETKIHAHINTLKNDVWLELNPNLTALEICNVFNHILFTVHQYSGNTSNFHAPQNSFINNVIESKKGSPLMLSIVYLLIAQELNLPIYGVNLPEHFVLAYINNNRNSLVQYDNNIMFYINPFSKGVIFGKTEIEQFIAQLKLEVLPQYYLPCSNVDMVKRLLRNLINSYQKLGYTDKQNELLNLLQQLE